MTDRSDDGTIFSEALVEALLRISAVVAGGTEVDMRSVMENVVESLQPIEQDASTAIDEVILQTYLVAGFPRALNAMRLWRSASGLAAPAADAMDNETTDLWHQRGEKLCATVYGKSYDKLRENVRQLHPALEGWMILHSYGMVLSRPELPAYIRELCTIAACAATGQQRQLHSHLHGALHTGATPDEIDHALDTIEDLIPAGDMRGYKQLFARIGPIKKVVN